MSPARVAAIGVAFATAVSARAAISYSSVAREVAANAGVTVPGTPSVASNSVPGVWTQSQFFATFGEPQGAGSYVGGAGLGEQDTTLGSDRISGSLTSTAWDGNQGFAGYARSTLSASFSLASASSYSLTGSWSASSPSSVPSGSEVARAVLSLIGPGGTVVSGGSTSSPSGVFNAVGTLDAGFYTLTITTWAQVGEAGINVGSRRGALLFDLLVPTPGPGALGLALGLLAARRRR